MRGVTFALSSFVERDLAVPAKRFKTPNNEEPGAVSSAPAIPKEGRPGVAVGPLGGRATGCEPEPGSQGATVSSTYEGGLR